MYTTELEELRNTSEIVIRNIINQENKRNGNEYDKMLLNTMVEYLAKIGASTKFPIIRADKIIAMMKKEDDKISKEDGKGRKELPDGTYNGEWQDEKPKRDAIFNVSYKDGRTYKGPLNQNMLPHTEKGMKGAEEGIITYQDRSTYIGELSNGKKHGKGAKDTKEERYIGCYVDNKEHGQGTKISFSNNGEVKSRYEGDFKYGKEDGKGRKEWPDGTSHEGEWKKGKEDGQGEITLNGDLTFKRTFKNGKKDSGYSLKKVNGIIHTIRYKNGEVVLNDTVSKILEASKKEISDEVRAMLTNSRNNKDEEQKI